MRRNFAQVLREGKIDIENEYQKLYDRFYKSKSGRPAIADIISGYFEFIPFHGTCLSLEEFDRTHDIRFEEQPQNFNEDILVSFCEYIYNFVVYANQHPLADYIDASRFIKHINALIESIGYMHATDDGVTIFVPKDNVAIVVSESEWIPDNISYKIIAYNHHSMTGDLEAKRQTLLIFADLLEPHRSALSAIDRNFTSDLFYAFNNFNIRHNNVDSVGSKYKKAIADLTDEQLEVQYDDVYQMCLLAFMRLDYTEYKNRFDVLKDKIENE